MCMSVFGYDIFHAVCKRDCAKVTYKSWQHVSLLCMDNRRDGETERNKQREIEARVRVMNPKSHCDCTNECMWHSIEWFNERKRERLREQRLDLEWLDIWHDFALITVYIVFICLLSWEILQHHILHFLECTPFRCISASWASFSLVSWATTNI